MLKIKDNVDLKELEKFDFELSSGGTVGTQDFTDNYVDDNYGYIKNYDSNFSIRDVKNEDRIILPISYYNECDLELIYDLIKADLVEKV